VPGVLELARAATAIVTIAGLAYTVFALTRVRAYRRTVAATPSKFAAITVLKPIFGLDFELEQNLRSFCEQDYPAFQIIFCLHRDDDEAMPIVRRLIEQYPDLDLTIAVGSSPATANPKIANLEKAMPLVRGDVLVIADADVRAGPTALRAIAATFADERVGAASCLYRGTAHGGVASALGAMHINDHFAPSVLVAAALEPMRFCLGATMAVRRRVLEEIGGLNALGAHLGDDYVLGSAVAQRGYAVALVPYTVTCIVFEPSLSAHWLHQLRWARTIRAQRPVGYAFLFITYPLPFALLELFLTHGAMWAVALVLATFAARLPLQTSRRNVWLIPLCDAIELAVWFAGCLGNGAYWRDRRFALQRGGRVGAEGAKTGAPADGK